MYHVRLIIATIYIVRSQSASVLIRAWGTYTHRDIIMQSIFSSHDMATMVTGVRHASNASGIMSLAKHKSKIMQS